MDVAPNEIIFLVMRKLISCNWNEIVYSSSWWCFCLCVCLSILADDDDDGGDDCGWHNYYNIFSRSPFVICSPVCVCLHLKYLSQKNISIIGTIRCGTVQQSVGYIFWRFRLIVLCWVRCGCWADCWCSAYDGLLNIYTIIIKQYATRDRGIIYVNITEFT